jgi:hypothetical protein
MPEIVILARGGSMHHARPLQEYFGARCIVESDWRPSVILQYSPDLVITFDEHGCELGLCIADMSRQGIATLQVMDGILEWRRTWAYPTSSENRPLNQPVLSHKVACLGKADAKIMESWGNVGKCEIVGCPRFDKLVELKRPMRLEPVTNRPLRLLIMTAKTPGFTPEQVEITYRSLADLQEYLEKRNDVEVIWRVTQKLHKRLGVKNTVKDVLSTELHDILGQVDAVITTPSTAMLEAMLCGLPVALLDYHNCPHYVPAAWRITCEEQIGPVLEDLKNAPLQRMLYQEYCLNDALSCKTPALPRMIMLIEEMIRIKKEHVSSGKRELVFPHRILDIPEDHISWPSENFDLQKLYPHHPVFGRTDITIMQAELEAALGTIDQLKNQVNTLSGRLHMIPGYKLAVKLRKFLKKKF